MKKTIVKKPNKGLKPALTAKGKTFAERLAPEKPLKIPGLKKNHDLTISHFYSSAYNEWNKSFRFYVHVTQIGGGTPAVLWLSRNQYKTGRNGHKCFYVATMTSRDGKHEAKWRNMTFTITSHSPELLVHSINEGNEFDMWSSTNAKSSDTKSLTLFSKLSTPKARL